MCRLNAISGTRLSQAAVQTNKVRSKQAAPAPPPEKPAAPKFERKVAQPAPRKAAAKPAAQSSQPGEGPSTAVVVGGATIGEPSLAFFLAPSRPATPCRA